MIVLATSCYHFRQYCIDDIIVCDVLKVIKMVDKGYRLPPPPGLSKELYKIMMQCWYLLCMPILISSS